MKTPRVVVVGSANVDLTTFTDVIPRPGETIFGRQFQFGFGGKGANQAVAARLCGADVAMIARVGDDLFSAATVQNFASYGIDTTHVRVTPGVSSGVAPIFVDSSGQNRILVIKGANDRLVPADIDAASNLLRRADMIVLQLEVPVETVYYTLRFAREQRIPAILNPAPAQAIDLPETGDYLIPNESEAEVLTGIAVGDLDSGRKCAASLLERGARRVVLTLGENGALVAGPEGLRHVPPFAVKPVDTSGAGDAFIGSLACFLSSGYDETEALSRASLYAALSTLGMGTQTSFATAGTFETEWAKLRPETRGVR